MAGSADYRILYGDGQHAFLLDRLVLLLIFSVHLGLFPIGLGVPIGMEQDR